MIPVAQTELDFDPMVPHRDLLLESDELTRRLSVLLSQNGPLNIQYSERVRVKYRAGKSLRVLTKIQVQERSYAVAARTFSGGRSLDAFERMVPAVVPCGPLRPVARDAELDTLFWVFPNDRKIANLSLLSAIPESLAQWFDPAWSGSRMVAYAPEKCATVQCLSEDREIVAYAKINAEDDGRRIQQNYDSVCRAAAQQNQPLRIPRALAYSDTWRTLFLENIPGKRLADLDGAEFRRGMKLLGASLATLHSLPAPDGLSPFRRHSAEALTTAADIVGAVRPDVADRARALAADLAPSNGALDDPQVCLHGDVHPKNAILNDGTLALVDLDQMALGSPACDLGSLLALLHYRRCIGRLAEGGEHELSEAFLAGYAGVRELPAPASLLWHTVAALLSERALRAVNRVSEEGLAHLPDLIQLAENLWRRRANV